MDLVELGSACALLQYQVVPSLRFSNTSDSRDLYEVHLQMDMKGCQYSSYTGLIC